MNLRHLRSVTRLAIVFLVPGWTAAYAAPVSHFRSVNGVRLEYLDWGGSGASILFLAGLGDTPYIYNDLAPAFVDRFHCVGLTRRGFGASEQPAGGYDLDNLVRDIAAFIEAMHLEDVTVVGHSFGGRETIRLAELRPDLVSRAILLDTAYEPVPASTDRAQALIFPAIAGMSRAEASRSLDSYREFQKRVRSNAWSAAAEANLLQQVKIGENGSVSLRTPGRVFAAFSKEEAEGKWASRTKIAVPALLVFAHNPMADALSKAAFDPKAAQEIAKASDELESSRRVQIEALRQGSPRARIIELDHTDHRCFIQRPAVVLTEMKAFLP